MKFNVSKDLSILIQISPSNQRTYKRVINPIRIRKIERSKIEWIPLDVDFSHEYFVLCQVDNKSSFNKGLVKIVKKTKATVVKWKWMNTNIEANPDDWIYYK